MGDETRVAMKTNAFIQENISVMRECKSFLSLPQINYKLLGKASPSLFFLMCLWTVCEGEGASGEGRPGGTGW